jgi:hypothetical protein
MASQKISDVLKPDPPKGTANKLMAFDDLTPPNDTLDDLGKTTSEVKTLLDGFFANKKIRQAIEDALIAAWNKEHPQAAAPPPAVAPVPAGSVDLSSKTTSPGLFNFKLGQTQTEFSIPSEFAPPVDDNTPVVSADELVDWEWIHLALNNNLTYAFDLNKFFKGGAIWARRAAFLWRTPLPRFKVYEAGEMKAQRRNTSQDDLAVRNGIVDASLSGGYAGSTASLKFSHKVNEANERVQQTNYMSVWFVQWKCYVKMRDSLVLSSEYTSAIDAALGQSANDAKFSALMKVFDDYGHVAPDLVYLGGSLLFQRSLKYNAIGNKDGITNSLDAAVQYEAKKAKVKAIGTITDESKTELTAELLETEVDFVAIGGDTTKYGLPPRWLVTTKSPALWRTIKREGMTPITTYLHPVKHKAVEAVFDAKRKDAWCSAEVSTAIAARGVDQNSWNVWLPGEKKEKQYLNSLLPIFAKD